MVTKIIIPLLPLNKPPAASADADRRAAWEISMAGLLSDLPGKRVNVGREFPPDTGGGWGKRPRRRFHDHVEGIRSHGAFFHELRMVEDRAT